MLIFAQEPRGLLANARWISTKLTPGSSFQHESLEETAGAMSMTAWLFDFYLTIVLNGMCFGLEIRIGIV